MSIKLLLMSSFATGKAGHAPNTLLRTSMDANMVIGNRREKLLNGQEKNQKYIIFSRYSMKNIGMLPIEVSHFVPKARLLSFLREVDMIVTEKHEEKYTVLQVQ